VKGITILEEAMIIPMDMLMTNITTTTTIMKLKTAARKNLMASKTKN
jgi:hypothetical protein